MRTTGNSVLITGGGTGIGLALAKAFVEAGNEVLICGRRKGRLKEAERLLPSIGARVCDIRSPAERRALARWALRGPGKLNILVNNAGIQREVDFTKGVRHLGRADDEVMTNLLAAIHLTAILIPHLLRRKEAAVLNVSSGLAFTPMARMPVYSATKAAIHSWSLSLRHQLKRTKIRVFEIAPPIVTSELGARHRPAGVNARAMPPGVVARETLMALERDDYEVAIGEAASLREKREALLGLLNP